MNLHQIPAFTQNFSIKFTCCVPEEAVVTITKPESLKIQKKIICISLSFFFFFCCCLVIAMVLLIT